MELYNENGIKFIPLKWVESVTGEICHVIYEYTRNNTHTYLIVDSSGDKKYCEAAYFKTINASEEPYEMSGLIFITLKSVECIKNETQYDDEFDYIRVGEVYPVILEMKRNQYIDYIIVNRQGTPQYFQSDNFIEI